MGTGFDLREAAWQIAPQKSQALYRVQLEAHRVVQERTARSERSRSHGKPSANEDCSELFLPLDIGGTDV